MALSKPVRITRDVVCALLVATLVAVVALGARLTQGPLAVNFLTPYLQSALNDTLGANNKLTIGDLNLEWTTKYHRVEFVAKQVVLSGALQNATIDRLGLNLSGSALLSGQLEIGLITLVNPRMSLVLAPHKVALPTNNADDDFLQQLQSNPRLKNLRVVAIQNGNFEITDPATNDTHTLTNVTVDFRRRLNRVKANVSATIKPATALTPFTITAKLQRSALNGTSLTFGLSTFSPDTLASAIEPVAPEALPLLQRLEQVQLPITVTGKVALDRNLNIATIAAHVNGEDGFIGLPDVYDHALPIKNLAGDISFASATEHIGWQNVTADILDSASTIHVKTAGNVVMDKDQTHFTGQMSLQNMLVDQLTNYWPPSVAPGGYRWITANMHGGKIPEVTMDFDMTDSAHGTVISKFDGGLAIEHSDVTFLDTMPPINDVTGTGKLNKDGIDFDITTGNIGDVRLQPSKIAITGFNDDIQNIDITAPLTGQLPEVLTLINRPPYKYADRFGLDPKKTIGGVGATLHFKFPLLAALKMDGVDMHVIANIDQVQIPKFIAGRDIRRGVGVMELTGKGLTVNGAADVAALPLANFKWVEDFTGSAPTTVTFNGSADADEIASVGVPVTEYVTGNTQFSGIYHGGTDSKLSLDLDLRHDTVGMRELNWQKPDEVPMTAKVDLVFKPDGTTQLPVITGSGPKISITGSGALNKAGDISALNLSHLILGDKINAALTYQKNDSGKRWQINGARFDAAGLFAKTDTSTKTPSQSHEVLAVNIGLGQLWLKDDMQVTNVGGDFIYNGAYWARAVLDAQMDNNNQLKILWQPEREDKELSITATNIGPVLKGFGITDTVIGGKLDVAGKADPKNPKLLTSGTITVTDFKVVKAPVLARLISLTSPMGLLDALRGQGLSFSKFATNFTYDDHALTFDKGKLSGGSLGLTFEGNVDLTKTPEQLHLNGTVIPLNGINNALANIPIIGAIAGGSEGGGIVGANYKITGPADNPEVSVNPLSLLAPGFLRDLLF